MAATSMARMPEGTPDSALWLLDPDMVGAFPTDNGQTF